MTFFDKKEEVMKIELTPHGKYLLSIGKFKPYSYKFFDENVVYDSTAIGTTEEQNKSHNRITDETPLLKCNPNITGVETNIRKFTSDSVAIKDMRKIISDDHMSTNNESIGTCAYETKNNSAIAVDLYEGNIIDTQVSSSYSSNVIDNVPIPQIPINMYVSSSIHPDVDALDAPDENILTYTDGTGIFLDFKNPIFRIREFNGFDEKDNFVLTAYRIVSSSSGITYKRLKIPERKSPIVGNLLVEDVSEQTILDDGEGAVSYSEEDLLYYVGITTDREISDEELCTKVKDYELENIFLDDEIICPDTIGDEVYDVYRSLVRPEDLEDCD